MDDNEYMTVFNYIWNEVMEEKTTKKRFEVIKQIDERLIEVHKARIESSPMRVNVKTDEEVCEMFEELVNIRKLCTSNKTFANIIVKKLSELKISLKG
jgi:DNA anti-recombination protein RmuC